MKYSQPYGISDPNAPYINGNPSTGTMGSIPPAASIEHPQREIANIISDAGLVPTDTDLRQLSKGIQGGKLFYSIDTGVANIVAISPIPAVAVLIAGMFFNVKIKETNNGPAVLQVSGLGGVQIVHADISPLVANELLAGAIACFFFDGTYFQLVWSQRIGVGTGEPVYLTRNMDYYVNGTSGSDAYDGIAPTVGGGHGPFQTIQRACTEVNQFNLNGFSVKVHVAAGVYAPFATSPLSGSGSCIFEGDLANPVNVHVNESTGTSSSSAVLLSGSSYVICGMKISANHGSGLVAAGGGISSYYNMRFGPCGAHHIQVHSGANLVMSSAGGAAFKQIDGGAGGAHLFVTQGSSHTVDAGPYQHLQILNPVNLVVWSNPSSQSLASEIYQSITGIGNVTAMKFSAYGLSLINTAGRGIGYLPGNVAGVLSSGAEYI